jgi:probable addiction module antidote protein
MTSTEAFAPFDPADYVRSPEEAALYLSDALESGDPKVVAAALGVVARARGATRLAEAAGISRSSLYNSLSETGNPTLALMMAVLQEMGLELRVGPRSSTHPAE